MDFIASRAKAFVGAAVPAIIYTLLGVAETSFGFTIDETIKVTIISLITGGTVYQVPNKVA